MKTKWNHSGRCLFHFRRPSGSALLQPLLLFSLLLTTAPACLITSCRPAGSDTLPVDNVDVQPDTSKFLLGVEIISALADSMPTVRHLDLLIYEEDGLRSLETWMRLNEIPDTISFTGTKRSKTVVAIANSPRSFNRSAVERFENLEQLCYDFSEDSPDAPIMSGLCSLLPERRGTVTVSPIMSRVELSGISNTMKGYARLEDPRIYLENMNAYAEVLRTSGFRPSDMLEGVQKQRLPYDIGLFTQHPGTSLFCYPNETPEGTVGAPRTVFVLECEIAGKTYTFPVELASLGRNKTLHVEMSIAGPGLCESRVY